MGCHNFQFNFFEYFLCPILFSFGICSIYIFNTFVALSNIYFKLIHINYLCLTFVYAVIDVA